MSILENALSPLSLSIQVAAAAGILILPLGIGIGWLLARGRFRGRNLLDVLFTLPMVLPPTVLGYYLLVLFGSRSWLGQILDYVGINLVFSLKGAIVAAVIVSLPLVIKPAKAAFESVDPGYEQAAATLGLGGWAIFFRVSLPLAWRPILAGWLLGIARSFGEFGATLMIAGSIPGQTQTLSIAIYEAVQAGQDSLANALSLIISVVCLAVLLLISFLLQPSRPKALK